MKKVHLLEKRISKDINGKRFTAIEDAGVGIFHGWESDYTEFESGAGNYTVAIIELEDGSIRKYNPEMIRFIRDKEDNINQSIAPIKPRPPCCRIILEGFDAGSCQHCHSSLIRDKWWKLWGKTKCINPECISNDNQ